MGLTVAVDLRGGDLGPQPLIEGIKRFLAETEDVEVIAYGLQSDAPLATGVHRLFFRGCEEEITTHDKPTQAVKGKKNSTLVCGIEAVKSKEAYGIVSPGNTGAVLTAAYLLLGRIKGVKRPLLMAPMPTLSGEPFVFGDLGANADVRADFFPGFAILGRVYYELLFGKENPSVYLLNIGEEEEKGRQLVKEARELLDAYPWFKGYVEPHAVWEGGYDVVVTDGFSGNVFLKTAEGVSHAVTGVLKEEIMRGGIMSKIGALMLKNAFKEMKKRFDYKTYGGAPFLGVRGLVMKMHGRSDADAAYSAVKALYRLAKGDIVGRIEERIESGGVRSG